MTHHGQDVTGAKSSILLYTIHWINEDPNQGLQKWLCLQSMKFRDFLIIALILFSIRRSFKQICLQSFDSTPVPFIGKKSQLCNFQTITISFQNDGSVICRYFVFCVHITTSGAWKHFCEIHMKRLICNIITHLVVVAPLRIVILLPWREQPTMSANFVLLNCSAKFTDQLLQECSQL